MLLSLVYGKLQPTFIVKRNKSNIYGGGSKNIDNKSTVNDFELITKLYALKINLDLLNNIEGKNMIKDKVIFNNSGMNNLFILETTNNYYKEIPFTNLGLSLNSKDLSDLDLSLLELKDTLDISKQERFLVKSSYMDVDMIYNNQNYVSIKKLFGNGITDVDAKNNIWLSNKFTSNKHNLQKLMNIGSSSYLTNFNFFEDSREFLMKRSNFFNNQQYNILSKNIILQHTLTNPKIFWNHETINQLYIIDMSQNNLKFMPLMPLDVNINTFNEIYSGYTLYTLDIPHNIILDPYTLDLITNLDGKTTNINSWL